MVLGLGRNYLCYICGKHNNRKISGETEEPVLGLC